MDAFTVSVIVPAYDSAKFIARALDSVFAQTFPDYEVIIINDGSPDTEELEIALEPYRKRIVYLKQENGGPGKARNNGIRCAQGKYVAFLDSDDSMLPECLETQLALFEKDHSLDLVYSDLLLKGDSPLSGKTFMETAPSMGEATFDAVLTEKCQIPTSAVIARKQALLDAGLFDESLFRAEDYDLWLRLAHLGKKIGYQRKILGIRCIHSAALSSDESKMLIAWMHVLKKLDRTLHLTDQSRALLKATLMRACALHDLERGKLFLASGNTSDALASLKKANEVLPNLKLRLVLLGLRYVPSLFIFLVRMRALSRFLWKSSRRILLGSTLNLH
jgi:glycosyltransferase involved in cell wall biosynthesis